MSDNDITSWNPEVFRSLKKLTTLTLSRNRIVTINMTSFIYLKQLRSLTLAGNPLACNCDLLWFKKWINLGLVFMPQLGDKKHYMCFSPHKMPLLDFQPREIDCISMTPFYWMAATGTAHFLLVTILTIVFRVRWYLRYWWFLLRMRRRQHEACQDPRHYMFDAFVSYHHKDRFWVIQQLLPELEYPGGYKLCLHDRDWLAGPDIADNIVNSIAASRKVVLILSNNFARSQWCQMEMTMAQHRLMDERRDALVPVLRTGISPQYPPTLPA